MTEIDEEFVKILINHDSGTETLWAVEKGNNYVLKNVPFYAYGMSYDDEIITINNKENVPVFQCVKKHSGNSTYRIYLEEPNIDGFVFYLKILQDLGCTYEKANPHLYAIDVPSCSDIYKVYEVLELGERKKIWEFEEGHCGNPLVKERST